MLILMLPVFTYMLILMEAGIQVEGIALFLGECVKALAAQMPIRRPPSEYATLQQKVTAGKVYGLDSLPHTAWNKAAPAVLTRVGAVIGAVNPAQGGLTLALAVRGKVDALPPVSLPHNGAIFVPFFLEVFREAFGERFHIMEYNPISEKHKWRPETVTITSGYLRLFYHGAGSAGSKAAKSPADSGSTGLEHRGG